VVSGGRLLLLARAVDAEPLGSRCGAAARSLSTRIICTAKKGVCSTRYMNRFWVIATSGHSVAATAVAELLLVAVSGLTDAETKERSLAAGFQHYVTKSIEFPVLEALLAMRAKSTSTGAATIH
jgi:hypothetical protein